jgi:hypothetical protein
LKVGYRERRKEENKIFRFAGAGARPEPPERVVRYPPAIFTQRHDGDQPRCSGGQPVVDSGRRHHARDYYVKHKTEGKKIFNSAGKMYEPDQYQEIRGNFQIKQAENRLDAGMIGGQFLIQRGIEKVGCNQSRKADEHLFQRQGQSERRRQNYGKGHRAGRKPAHLAQPHEPFDVPGF